MCILKGAKKFHEEIKMISDDYTKGTWMMEVKFPL
jgi:hypothetical protein